jgi:hypothetical protein
MGPNDKQLFVSGDYEASTDWLDIECTRAALRGMCSQAAFTDIYETGLMAINEVKILYKDFDDRKDKGWDRLKKTSLPTDLVDLEQFWNSDYILSLFPESCQQRNGQLMGSPVSFPLLCCSNLAIVRWAFELYYNMSFKLDELPIQVNGDDIGFAAEQGVIDIWSELVQLTGFKFSVGKNYVSSDFIMMNSELFYCSLEKEDSIFGFLENEGTWKVEESQPYLNCGLLRGVTKGSTGQTDIWESKLQNWNKIELDVTTRIRGHDVSFNSLIKGCAQQDRIDCIAEIFINERLVRDVVPSWINPGLPLHLNGMGLPSKYWKGSKESNMIALMTVKNRIKHLDGFLYEKPSSLTNFSVKEIIELPKLTKEILLGYRQQDNMRTVLEFEEKAIYEYSVYQKRNFPRMDHSADERRNRIHKCGEDRFSLVLSSILGTVVDGVKEAEQIEKTEFMVFDTVFE